LIGLQGLDTIDKRSHCPVGNNLHIHKLPTSARLEILRAKFDFHTPPCNRSCTPIKLSAWCNIVIYTANTKFVEYKDLLNISKLHCNLHSASTAKLFKIIKENTV